MDSLSPHGGHPHEQGRGPTKHAAGKYKGNDNKGKLFVLNKDKGKETVIAKGSTKDIIMVKDTIKAILKDPKQPCSDGHKRPPRIFMWVPATFIVAFVLS